MIGIVALEVKAREIIVRADHVDGEGVVQLLIHGENILSLAIKNGQDGDKVLHYQSHPEDDDTLVIPRGIFIGYDDEAPQNHRFMVDINSMTINEALSILKDVNAAGPVEQSS